MHARTTGPRGRRPGPPGVALALLVATAVAVAACGGSSPGSPSPPAGSSASSPGAPSSAGPGASGAPAIAAPLRPGAFTFDLPTGWRAVPTTGDDALVARLERTNPAFATSLQARLDNLSENTTFVAVDTREQVVKAGHVVTLIVTELDLPADVTLGAFANLVQAQAQQLVERPVAATRILVASGEAYLVEYVAPIERPGGATALVAITQALFLVPGRGYVMTFSAPPSVAPDYGKTFAGIATSFMLTP